ncbi:POZ domain-containing protein [Fragilariopsis cylindrus CCMP1102]|uniref:POZ domain-containing protein n=1 Tax=Fragilariopsis cylindrus CCMP1102 TaxID=635003 RepID=A0A1E7FJF4_9STRA|nr:POZ domain-containing protein [Fragilariopsis cylindrus CCMP1102]|eukprot:OEU18296.1 POZ domain-containing protein [Fragilariopsis cylindrus CCMP1102]
MIGWIPGPGLWVLGMPSFCQWKHFNGDQVLKKGQNIPMGGVGGGGGIWMFKPWSKSFFLMFWQPISEWYFWAWKYDMLAKMQCLCSGGKHKRDGTPKDPNNGGEENESTICEAEALTEGKLALKLKQFKLNIGGTRYEVSNSLLDQFPGSMLRRITSDTWNNESNDPLLDPDLTKKEEIFIERDGGRFKFVLDYMRDGEVSLPLSIPRQQLVSDMEYYGIDFDETRITLGVANPNDAFHKLSEYYYEKERFKKIFQVKQKDIEISYCENALIGYNNNTNGCIQADGITNFQAIFVSILSR